MLIQRLISSDKYGIKCPYVMDPIGICIHNTANDASAANEIAYMQRNNNEVSFHIAIDDKEAIQGIPFNRNAWAAGDGNGQGNRRYIHVEICYSKSGGPKFEAAEKIAAQEVAALLKQYGWGIDRVTKHQDFSGKYCPHRTLDMGWQRFLNMIQAELNGASQENGELYRVRKSWGDAASQKGAYSIKENAIAECKKHSGYSVFDSKGNVVYSNGGAQPSQPAPTKEKIDLFSRVAVKGRGSNYYDWVKNLTDYTGDKKNPCCLFMAYPTKGEVRFRVSPISEGRYYSEVQNYYSSKGIYDEAGLPNVPFDKIQMRFDLPGYKIRYRAMCNGRWLDWVENGNSYMEGHNGYAGLGDGTPITAIECEIVAV